MPTPIVVVEPVGEPISRQQCQQHLRLDGAWDSPWVDDVRGDLIEGCLSAGREHAEAYTGLSIVPKTLELALDRFGCHDEIELTQGPVQAITSVVYVDESGDEQTLDPSLYTLVRNGDRFWLFPAVDATWPSTSSYVNSVKIRYPAGYSLPGDSPQVFVLPKSIRQALLVMMQSGAVTAGLVPPPEPRVTSADLWQAGLNILNPHRQSLGV